MPSEIPTKDSYVCQVRLYRSQKSLKGKGAWTHPKNFHHTINCLGTSGTGDTPYAFTHKHPCTETWDMQTLMHRCMVTYTAIKTSSPYFSLSLFFQQMSPLHLRIQDKHESVHIEINKERPACVGVSVSLSSWRRSKSLFIKRCSVAHHSK